MPVTVVVGAQWGAMRAKPRSSTCCPRSTPYVVRYQGGHNAGHTVVVDGERYALQLVPSGILYDHVVPVIANGVVVDLPTLFNEVDMLESRGISCAELNGIEPRPPESSRGIRLTTRSPRRCAATTRSAQRSRASVRPTPTRLAASVSESVTCSTPSGSRVSCASEPSPRTR